MLDDLNQSWVLDKKIAKNKYSNFIHPNCTWEGTRFDYFGMWTYSHSTRKTEPSTIILNCMAGETTHRTKLRKRGNLDVLLIWRYHHPDSLQMCIGIEDPWRGLLISRAECRCCRRPRPSSRPGSLSWAGPRSLRWSRWLGTWRWYRLSGGWPCRTRHRMLSSSASTPGNPPAPSTSKIIHQFRSFQG